MMQANGEMSHFRGLLWEGIIWGNKDIISIESEAWLLLENKISGLKILLRQMSLKIRERVRGFLLTTRIPLMLLCKCCRLIDRIWRTEQQTCRFNLPHKFFLVWINNFIPRALKLKVESKILKGFSREFTMIACRSDHFLRFESINNNNVNLQFSRETFALPFIVNRISLLVFSLQRLSNCFIFLVERNDRAAT